jgi:small subunit ribosomal protein S14
MAKLSVIERNKKRILLEKKYQNKRQELKKLARESYAKGEIPWEIQQKLQVLPKNSNLTRVQKRCNICGRGRGVYKKFGLCRLCLRKYAMLGYVSGLSKASW